MRQLLASAVKRALPERLLSPILAERSRRHQKQVLEQLGISAASRKFIQLFGLTVRYGPFAGMRYTADVANDRLIVPKLLGTYEFDVQPLIRLVQSADRDLIVDIGCAEGYYTTGFAMTTGCTVVAFDASKKELAFAREMAKENGVTCQIDFRDWCDPEDLRGIVRDYKRPFVLSDCEGYEIELFGNDLGAFAHCNLLIELHGDAKTLLLPKLSASHSIQIIPFVRRYDANLPELESFTAKEREAAVDECRSPQEWLWAEPH